MNGTERKRRWREANPERSAEYEADRAEARRNGYWGRWERGKPKPRECLSSDSYYRYERGIGRTLAQLKWSSARSRARIAARYDDWEKAQKS